MKKIKNKKKVLNNTEPTIEDESDALAGLSMIKA